MVWACEKVYPKGYPVAVQPKQGFISNFATYQCYLHKYTGINAVTVYFF